MKSTLAADQTDMTNPYTGLTGIDYGVDFNPVVDRLRVVSDTGMNLRINVDSGAVITDGTLNSTGMPTRTGVTGAAYLNSFSATCRTTLFFIDSANMRLLVTNDPNNGVVSEVGNLGIIGGTSNGFEILTGSNGTNQALAAFSISATSSVILYTINTTNGAVTPNGTITGLNTGEMLRGLAVAPPSSAPNQAPGNVVAVSETNKLITFNNASPQKLCTSNPITGLNANENVLGVDVRPADGKLYALSSAGRVLTINTQTAAATQVSTLSATLSGTEFGVDFNPTVDRMRIVSDAGQNLRVNVDTGATTTDINLNPAGVAVTAAGYTNSFQGATSTTLFVFDTASDQLMIQGQPSGSPNNGDVLAVGSPLGVDAGPMAAFEINAINNMALAAVNPATATGFATTSDLYTVNLSTGVGTRVNTIGGGERVRSIAFNSNPTVQVMGLTDDGRLVSFKLSSINAFDTSFPITGLQGGESLVGIDYRPANGRLYGVSDGGNLYTLDPASGGATLVAPLSGATLPTATVFGVDFNPTADRLRIVSAGGVNLRVNPDTGAVVTDTPLNPLPATVVASAYTQNFAASPATRLLGLDANVGNLVLQNPPNDGVLSLIGSLGVAFTGTASFDIVGGGDGLALAALQTSAGAQSGLYTLNLTTGVATALGANNAIGPAGTPPLRALSIRLQ